MYYAISQLCIFHILLIIVKHVTDPIVFCIQQITILTV